MVQGSPGGIATCYGLDGPRIRTRVGGENFLTSLDLPSIVYNGYRVSSPGTK